MVGADGVNRRDLSIQQPGLAVFKKDVGISELRFTSPNAFHFPALQRDTGFNFVTKKVIVPSSLVLSDGVARLLRFFLRH